MLTYSWDPPLADSQHTSKKMSNARILSPSIKIFEHDSIKIFKAPSGNFLLKKPLWIQNHTLNTSGFSIRSLICLLLELVFFSFYLLFLNILSADIFARPHLADTILTKLEKREGGGDCKWVFNQFLHLLNCFIDNSAKNCLINNADL